MNMHYAAYAYAVHLLLVNDDKSAQRIRPA
jgi:hypothetical protein